MSRPTWVTINGRHYSPGSVVYELAVKLQESQAEAERLTAERDERQPCYPLGGCLRAAHAEQLARAEKAEADLADLRAGIETLADEWKAWDDDSDWTRQCTKRSDGQTLRALLTERSGT